MRIKIVGTPQSDFAPPWVREGWNGITMESTGKEDSKPMTDCDVLVGRIGNQNRGGYKVSGAVALAALQKHNDKAYQWWQQNLPNMKGIILVFHADVCQEIE